jgi:protein TonB
MSTKIQEHILTKFNLSIANNLGLPGGIQRIYVNFKIDSKGHVVDVKSRASHPKLADEAVRVVQSIPQMKPGENQGQTVGVLYSLPIIFMVEEESAKEKRARLKREKRALKKSQ